MSEDDFIDFPFLQVGYVSSLEGTFSSIGGEKVIVSPYGKIFCMFFVIFSYHVCVCAETKHARRRKNVQKQKKTHQCDEEQARRNSEHEHIR